MTKQRRKAAAKHPVETSGHVWPPKLGTDPSSVLAHTQKVTAYLAPLGLEQLAIMGLKQVLWVHDRLIFCSGPPQPCVWAQDIWYDVHLVPIVSIGDGVRILKNQQRSWIPYAPLHYRRLMLFAKQLPPVKQKPLSFPPDHETVDGKKSEPVGVFTLLGPTLLAYSQSTARPYPLGEARFTESKEGPPSRAYLKLYEALTLMRKRPRAGDRCLEIGAAPGGWTWVLTSLGASVISYDRAPLAPALATSPLVTHHRKDAFSALPGAAELDCKLDWIFSDIICYPGKLLEWVKAWLATGIELNFVCTLKFQGDEHYGVIQQFAAIPGSRLVHLFNNKHELTWILER